MFNMGIAMEHILGTGLGRNIRLKYITSSHHAKTFEGCGD